MNHLEEGVVGCADAFEEEVVPVEELAVALQQEHCDWQHAPQHVQEPVAQLHAQRNSILNVSCHDTCHPDLMYPGALTE